ncbi:MAG: hypothetical protein RBU21_01805 [FCB group bacterium]|jgi:anti-sigma factor RsiW|nr:hypothetical protein [FCB group bacterium]
MSHKHVSIDELSAYLDGEARHSTAVRDHLQRCAECAQRHAELAKLSSHMRTLPAPDVSPAFATRVMAAVRETRPEPLGFRWLRWASVGMGVAAGLVLAAAWVMNRPPAAPPAVAANSPAHAVDAERLMQVIEARIAQGEDPGAVEYAGADWDNAEAVPASADLELAQLAQSEWFDPLAEEVESTIDVDTMIASLSPEQVQVFKQLLAAYAKEG